LVDNVEAVMVASARLIGRLDLCFEQTWNVYSYVARSR